MAAQSEIKALLNAYNKSIKDFLKRNSYVGEKVSETDYELFSTEQKAKFRKYAKKVIANEVDFVSIPSFTGKTYKISKEQERELLQHKEKLIKQSNALNVISGGLRQYKRGQELEMALRPVFRNNNGVLTYSDLKAAAEGLDMLKSEIGNVRRDLIDVFNALELDGMIDLINNMDDVELFVRYQTLKDYTVADLWTEYHAYRQWGGDMEAFEEELKEEWTQEIKSTDARHDAIQQISKLYNEKELKARSGLSALLS